jgi:hypothetical protein
MIKLTRRTYAGLLLVIGSAAHAQTPGELLPSPTNPPTRQGTRGANFLQIGVGARAAGMGGAVVSMVDGPTAWYWNPAGAANTESFALAASHQNLYDDLNISVNYGAVVLPALGGAFGVGVTTLSSGDMLRTTEDAPFGNPTFGENFSFSASAVNVGYARRLTDRLDVGGTLKFVTEGLTDVKTNWAAVDLGTQFRTGLYGLVIGASLQNIGPAGRARGELIRRRINTDQAFNQNTKVEFDVEDTDLPTLFRFSVGTDVLGRAGSILGPGGGIHTLDAELAFNDAIDTNMQFAWGAEYGFKNMAFLRLGKRFYNDDRAIGGSTGMYGLSGGLGVKLPVSSRFIRFDYGYTSLGELQNVQVFSFEFGR